MGEFYENEKKIKRLLSTVREDSREDNDDQQFQFNIASIEGISFLYNPSIRGSYG